MANFVSPNQIQKQIGLVLLVRHDTRDDTSQPWSCTYQNGADDDHAELLGERREELCGGALLGALRELAPRMLLAGAERERHRCKESAEH